MEALIFIVLLSLGTVQNSAKSPSSSRFSKHGLKIRVKSLVFGNGIPSAEFEWTIIISYTVKELKENFHRKFGAIPNK